MLIETMALTSVPALLVLLSLKIISHVHSIEFKKFLMPWFIYWVIYSLVAFTSVGWLLSLLSILSIWIAGLWFIVIKIKRKVDR